MPRCRPLCNCQEHSLDLLMCLNDSIRIKSVNLASSGSKKHKVLFYDKKSHRRQRVELLTTLPVLVETFHEHRGTLVVALVPCWATNTERAPAAKKIYMVLREVDFCPLSETPSLTSVFNVPPKMQKNNNNKLENEFSNPE